MASIEEKHSLGLVTPRRPDVRYAVSSGFLQRVPHFFLLLDYHSD